MSKDKAILKSELLSVIYSYASAKQILAAAQARQTEQPWMVDEVKEQAIRMQKKIDEVLNAT